MEEGADFGLPDMEDLRQGADVIPIPGQGGLQRVEILAPWSSPTISGVTCVSPNR